MKLRLFTYVTIFAALLTASNSHAQVYINGHRVASDESRGMWLCSIPEDNFGQSFKALVTFGDTISAVTIDNISVTSGDSISFGIINGTSAIAVEALTSEGKTLTASLQFTFLPIVEFNGIVNKLDFVTLPFSIMRPDDEDISALAKVRYRGSLTNQNNVVKRGYRVKFVDAEGNKLDIRPFANLREDNNWVLEGGAADLLRVRNYVCAGLWNDMATKPYYSDEQPRARTATRGQLVELFRNGEYIGLYDMCEPIDRKQMRLVKYEEDTMQIHGLLWKADDRSRVTLMDTMPPKVPNGYYTRFDKFEIKYPDIEEVHPTDYTPLYNLGVLSAYADDETFAEQIADRVDIPAIIDYYIFCEALFAFDSEGKNVYWGCYDRTQSEKLTPAMWDIDVSFGQDWKVTSMHGDRVQPWNDFMNNVYNHHRFLKRLRSLDVDGFNAKVNQRYQELRSVELSDDSLCNRFIEVIDMLKRSGTATREQNRYNPDALLMTNIDFDSELSYIVNWIPRRMKYLDDYVFVEHRIKRGDVNDDGIIDVSDVNQIINMILNFIPGTPIGDANYDSRVDVADVNYTINIILGLPND
ncbi:MAG: CotH kinase family protein [Muribaculaceae bacterium]|nr:CotH kinase family protein [Muribaculaceae bacterium]